MKPSMMILAPIMKHVNTLTPIIITLIGAMIIDYLATWPYVMTPLYAIPVLLAAYRMGPRSVAMIAVLVTVINLASGLLEGTPLDVVLLYTSGLLIIAYLAIALASQRQKTARYTQIAEQQARATELAYQRLQAFLAMVAHELRNPLTAILGSIQMFEQLGKPILPVRQQQLLTLIATAARSMGRLLNDLRDASAIGAGHFVIRKTQTDLVEIARRVAALQQSATPDHHFIMDAPEHLEGMWDGERLNQLLANLISNAVKYSPAGGTVRSRCPTAQARPTSVSPIRVLVLTPVRSSGSFSRLPAWTTIRASTESGLACISARRLSRPTAAGSGSKASRVMAAPS